MSGLRAMPAAALNVTAYGGNTGFPDKEGLKEFMEKKKVEETK